MADADLSAQNSLPFCDSITTSTTASDSAIPLPGHAATLGIYLPGQTWAKVWERPRRGPTPVTTVFVAAGAGTPTLHYRVN